MHRLNSVGAASPLMAGYVVSLTELVDRERLAREWTTLERRAQASFFLTWNWIGTLLEAAESADAPLVLRVTVGDSLRGLALLWRGRVCRHGLLRSRSLYLNETGRPEFDRLTLEHNGILAAVGEEASVLQASVAFLKCLPGWDECVCSGLDALADHTFQQAAEGQGLWYRQRWEKTYHYIRLGELRRQRADYLESLSANTRYQARRALKGYSALGPLVCDRANTAPQALQWFGDLIRLHQAYWAARGEPGAFSSEFTRRFHAALIARATGMGSVSLLRVTAGEELLGFVYNFEHSGIAYNYQSGHVTSTSGKLKPGLVVHCMAVQEALQRGLHTYDLLMGGDHFKPSLCNASGLMGWSVLQRRSMSLGLENWARRMRDRWQMRQPRSAPKAAPASDIQTGAAT